MSTAHEPAIFHLTHWKAGSQWVYVVLRELFPERTVHPKARQAHVLESPLRPGLIYPTAYIDKPVFDELDVPSNHRKFLVIRDLRDSLVSWYFSLSKTHVLQSKAGKFDRVAIPRQRMVRMSVEEGLLYILHSQLFQIANIQTHWYNTAELVVRYEDLLDDDLTYFRQILDYCELSVDENHFESVVRNNRFSNVTGRERGDEDDSSHFRKGIAGDWKNYFTPSLTEAFKELYGDVLIQTGYENDYNWDSGTPFGDVHPVSHETARESENNQPPIPDADDYQARIAIAKAGMKQVTDIPKVSDAGEIVSDDGSRFQVMFNGVKVPADAYYGAWSTELIADCQGHHEPQEEYVFHHVLQKAPPDAQMLELGSYWAFYTTWFLTHTQNGQALLVEPNPKNLPVALATLNANNCSATIELGAIGGRVPEFEGLNLGAASQSNYNVPVFEVDGLMQRHGIDHLYILHSDIQGAEKKMLEGASQALTHQQIDYIFISTHSDVLHKACLVYLKAVDYRILAAHTLAESYSYDGLIVACSPAMTDFESFDLLKRTAADWQPSPERQRNKRQNQLVQQLRGKLEEKEAVIQELVTARNTLSERLNARLAEQVNLQEQLLDTQQSIHHKETVIQELKAATGNLEAEKEAHQNRIDSLETETHTLQNRLEDAQATAEARYNELVKKEAAIQQLLEYRKSSAGYLSQRVGRSLRRLVNKPLNILQRFRGRIHSFLNRPRIGRLIHYEPRELDLPDSYFEPYTRDVDALPTISIATPSYNQADFIGETIESVINQGYPKLEYIIQDGASNDGTVDVLKQYEDRVDVIESKPDNGQAHAVNMGLRKSSGDIMAYLNSDDLLLPGTLHYVGEFFANNPDVDAIYGDRIMVNEHSKEVGVWILPDHSDEVLKWADFVPQETLFWRRRVWEKIGEFDESFQFALDWDYLVRMVEANCHIIHVPRFMGCFRIHESQKTLAQHEVGHKDKSRIYKRLHGYVPSQKEIDAHLQDYYKQHLRQHQLYRLGIIKKE